MKSQSKPIKAALRRLRSVQSFFYDFDGVMTDNKVQVFSDGKESVACNRADGLAVAFFKKRGLHQCIISTERNSVVLRRARKLGIPCLHNCADKAAILRDYQTQHKINLSKSAYVGNDLNDLEAFKMVGLKIAPSDASREILALADIVTRARGGGGVVRELMDLYGRY